MNRAATGSFFDRLPFGGKDTQVPVKSFPGHPVVVPNKVIDTYKNFPDCLEMLSGPSAPAGLRIPQEVQNYAACFKNVSGEAFLCYVHEQSSRVRSYLHAMRSELAALKIPCSTETLIVTEQVLTEARKAAEVRKSNSSSSVSSRYEAVEQFREWVQIAARYKATDLHMEILAGGRGQVMVRVDGELEALEGTQGGLTDTQVHQAMKAAYETLADRHSNSDGTFSDAKGISCMISTSLGIPNLRLRFTSQRCFFGPTAVMRLLTTDVSKEPMSFEAMGFAPSHIDLFEKAQRMDQGIILQCGVTGSGKTTTAKTLIETHPKNGRAAIYQIADPVEYIVKGTRQIPVQRDILTLAEAGKKDSYSEVVENMLRQDLDIADLGEIRDVISARALANVCKSGHLALGTLHVGRLSGILSRLSDPKIGLDRAELTNGSLPSLLCYQALVPILCKECRLDADSAKAQLLAVGEDREAAYLGRIVRSMQKLPLNADAVRFKNMEGCEVCLGRGTSGLTIVSEMMIPDDDWLDMSADGKDRNAWKAYQRNYSDRNLTSANMHGKSVVEHTMYKSQLGLVDPRQIERFDALDTYEVIK